MLETEVQQPALVATSLAINEAIRVRGIRPDFVVGHSVGEFAALGAGEALTPAEAIALVRERGLAMAEAAAAHPGSMAAILGLADEVVEKLCTRISNVWPANYNCPGQIVISGEDRGGRGMLAQAEDEAHVAPSGSASRGASTRRWSPRRRPAAAGDRPCPLPRAARRVRCRPRPPSSRSRPLRSPRSSS